MHIRSYPQDLQDQGLTKGRGNEGFAEPISSCGFVLGRPWHPSAWRASQLHRSVGAQRDPYASLRSVSPSLTAPGRTDGDPQCGGWLMLVGGWMWSMDGEKLLNG